jgi:nitroimidazol reductase NimA-like FMN-containing flavoprotein (pyridoxamine 5'-phosphate oxidase superfamily)
MRRKEREITVLEEKMDIIAKNKVCRLGLSKDNFPYVVPLNYGYSFEDNTLVFYFHGAAEGRKMDIIKENNNACFEIDFEGNLIEGKDPCSYSYMFKSIIGFGKIIMMPSIEEKTAGLNKIMSHQTGKETACNFPEAVLKNMAVYKLTVEEFTGKQRNI